jgi:hypothetical protein
MARREDWMDIRALSENGMYQKDIAHDMGMHHIFGWRSLIQKHPWISDGAWPFSDLPPE